MAQLLIIIAGVIGLIFEGFPGMLMAMGGTLLAGWIIGLLIGLLIMIFISRDPR